MKTPYMHVSYALETRSIQEPPPKTPWPIRQASPSECFEMVMIKENRERRKKKGFLRETQTYIYYFFTTCYRFKINHLDDTIEQEFFVKFNRFLEIK